MKTYSVVVACQIVEQVNVIANSAAEATEAAIYELQFAKGFSPISGSFQILDIDEKEEV